LEALLLSKAVLFPAKPNPKNVASNRYSHWTRYLTTALCILQLVIGGCSRNAVQPVGSKDATSTFTNPIMDGADPWVVKRDSFYYYCGARDGAIFVSKSQQLTRPGEFKQVWKAPPEGWNRTNVWAPELHYLDGKWYIYYAAGEAGPPFIHQRSGVLESVTGDPQGAYVDKGMLYTGDDLGNPASAKWAIDLTPFRLNGQLYAAWSGWEENAITDRTPQHLYIARMSNPWTISSNRVKISSPVEPWEDGAELDLNEGPELLKRNGKAFIIYSCRESWLPAYQLGQLTLGDTLRDPMVPAHWQKKGPVFSGTNEVYGVGHPSFTVSPDGTEDWIAYHTKKDPSPGWNRDVRLQKFTWNADGSPNFGTPVARGILLPLPAGEK
jgi:GH43 family beta-xylosidase